MTSAGCFEERHNPLEIHNYEIRWLEKVYLS